MKTGEFDKRELLGQFCDALVSEPAVKPETKARMKKIMQACTLHTAALKGKDPLLLPVYALEDHQELGEAVTDRRSHVMAAVPEIVDGKLIEAAPSVVLLDIADVSTMFHEFVHLLSLQPYSKAGEGEYKRKWGVREDMFSEKDTGQLACVGSLYTCMNELLTDYCAEEMMRRCGIDAVYRKRKVRSAGYMDFCEAVELLGIEKEALLSLYFNEHDEASREMMDLILRVPGSGGKR